MGHFKDGVIEACDEVCGKREGEVKEIRGGGKKSLRRQLQERKKHTRQCVKIVLRRIRGGKKA